MILAMALLTKRHEASPRTLWLVLRKGKKNEKK